MTSIEMLLTSPLIHNSLLHLLASGELNNNGFLHLSTARTRTVIVGGSSILTLTKGTLGREKTFQIEQVQAIEPLLSLATIPGTALSS
jgi:hypothetical protein